MRGRIARSSLHLNAPVSFLSVFLPSDNQRNQVFLGDLVRPDTRPKLKDSLSRLHLRERVDRIKISRQIVVREVSVFLKLRERLRNVSHTRHNLLICSSERRLLGIGRSF